ncbi:hypothetical protein RchiOBHm_Chr1g0341061 [Rosa chinensis]|uniref:RNase H type-1 domain-containing protein n=1 Tax=Rosa chinensis TaxID=74649 RepID=A0A2P6SDN4_ROSCH|nr:hypothetical protein RchiOBHm_Chr1g0341061 [Rosa chinensis]
MASSSKILWSFAFCNAVWCIWTERNKIRFHETTFNLARFQHWFLISLRESASIHFLPCSNSLRMQGLFAVLGLSSLTVKAPKYIPVQWTPPPAHWLKVNTDGSFRDNRTAGSGGYFEIMRGNAVADALANHGALNAGYRWWDDLPSFIVGHYGRDQSSMFYYRFC